MWRTDLLRKCETGNKNEQLALRHCRKTGRIMMLRVLSPTNKTLPQNLYILPVLPAQRKLVLLQVMSIQYMAWLPRNFVQSGVRTNTIWIFLSSPHYLFWETPLIKRQLDLVSAVLQLFSLASWKSRHSSERMTTSTCCLLRQGWLRMRLITNETVNTIRNQIVQTYHVCAEGNLSVDRSSRWIWNFWNPFMPSRAAKPCNGTLLVPVTNWRNLARSAWSKDLRALQNHWIYYKKKMTWRFKPLDWA